MDRKQVQRVVLTTTMLILVTQIVREAIQMPESAWDDPIARNLTSTMAALNATSGRFKSTTIVTPNGTLIDSVTGLPFSWDSELTPSKKDVYLHFLPLMVFGQVPLIVFLQYWNILLEKWFPSRRPKQTAPERVKAEKVRLPCDEKPTQSEKQIPEHSIAQGNPKGTSLNIKNTLFKWILNIVIGTLAHSIFTSVLRGLVMEHKLHIDRETFTWDVIGGYSASFMSGGPLLALLGFIIIPAQERVIFNATADLCTKIFAKLFLTIFVPWFIRTDVVQGMMYLYTKAAWEKLVAEDVSPVHIIDEL